MERIKQYRVPGKVSKILTEIERFHGAFESGHKLNSKFIANLKKTTIITSSGSSTRIEGAILTDVEVQDFIDKGCKISKMSTRSEREVAGYIKALNFIYNNYSNLKITEKNIRELHQVLTSELTSEQLPKKQRGVYKDITNHVVEKNFETGKEVIWFKTTPPGPQTASAMEDLIRYFNEIKEKDELHPIVLTAAFIVHFLAIHPFRDGNGRLSRLITVWLMLKFSYRWFQYASHEKVIEDNKERYYISLRETQNSFYKKKANYDRWISYFCETILKQTKIISGLLNKESPVTIMNKNEKTVYQILKSNGDCNIGFILENVEMTRAGLKTLMKRMVDAGHVKVKGQGKGTIYFI